jgi:hypothetical protein
MGFTVGGKPVHSEEAANLRKTTESRPWSTGPQSDRAGFDRKGVTYSTMVSSSNEGTLEQRASTFNWLANAEKENKSVMGYCGREDGDLERGDIYSGDDFEQLKKQVVMTEGFSEYTGMRNKGANESVLGIVAFGGGSNGGNNTGRF